MHSCERTRALYPQRQANGETRHPKMCAQLSANCTLANPLGVPISYMKAHHWAHPTSSCTPG